MSRPIAFDYFCCQGGAGMGYYRAGFEVIGIDKDPQPRYPFKFIQADALEHMAEHGDEADIRHASPPCHIHSHGTAAIDRGAYEDLIPATREALSASDRPYVIENVEGARRHLINPVMLCGSMFGLTAVDTDGELLRLERHRLFESNVTLWPPFSHYHPTRVRVAGAYGGARSDKHEARNERHGGYVPSIPVQQQLLGIDWMTQKGMHQAIPPAFTEWIGAQLIDHLANLGPTALKGA